MNNNWQLQTAKSKFSELVERTLHHGAQVVTRHGKKVVVIVPFEEYEQLTRPKESLTQFLIASPLAGSELSIDRDKSMPRKIEIEP
ncbi:MAG: type II toxin-antitoxin system Phd/YefM family antitoxin [Anaerolineaceae bacterium]|nr:type II toxin-antitoxin system Phd/YefM family antitoxin [Anaerolineaceae bacterium]